MSFSAIRKSWKFNACDIAKMFTGDESMLDCGKLAYA
jgi:hypothetical protein